MECEKHPFVEKNLGSAVTHTCSFDKQVPAGYRRDPPDHRRFLKDLKSVNMLSPLHCSTPRYGAQWTSCLSPNFGLKHLCKLLSGLSNSGLCDFFLSPTMKPSGLCNIRAYWIFSKVLLKPEYSPIRDIRAYATFYLAEMCCKCPKLSVCNYE